MTARRLLAIDPSLTCSGWALFSVESRRLVAVGKIRSLARPVPLARRLGDLQQKIKGVFEELKLGLNDVLVCESPTTMKDPHSAIKVEQVRGMFEVIARERAVNVPGRINPRTVQREIMGLTGKQVPREQIKELAVSIAIRLFGKDFRELGLLQDATDLADHQDIVDAVLVGSLALTKLQAALIGGIGVEQLLEHQGGRRRAA